MRTQLRLFAFAAACLMVLTVRSSATTSYFVRVRPAGAALYSSLTFDVTHSDTVCRNRVTFTNFSSDGHLDSAVVEAGPGYGDLLVGANPAALTTLEAQYFYNGLTVPFDSLRGLTTMRVAISEEGPTAVVLPDEVSMYLLNRDTGLPSPTGDGLGAGALFALDITGGSGGALTVFSPMVFVPPDTLSLQGLVDSVPRPRHLDGRLQIVALIPNPAKGALRISYVVPPPRWSTCY